MRLSTASLDPWHPRRFQQRHSDTIEKLTATSTASNTAATQTGERVTGRLRARTAMTVSEGTLTNETETDEERTEVADSRTRSGAAAMQ